ncbi:hypothetical protein Emed_005380 [Eimeria media]
MAPTTLGRRRDASQPQPAEAEAQGPSESRSIQELSDRPAAAATAAAAAATATVAAAAAAAGVFCRGGEGAASKGPPLFFLCFRKMASVRLCPPRLLGLPLSIFLFWLLLLACRPVATATADVGACSSGAQGEGQMCAAAGELPAAPAAAGELSAAAAAAAAAAAESSRLQALEAYTLMLEEKLQHQERQQREQQKSSSLIFIALIACVGIVLLIALVACKVYINSIQAQLRFPDEQQEKIDGAACDASACSTATAAAPAAARRRQQPLLQQARESQRSSNNRAAPNTSSSSSRNAYLEALDADFSEDDETPLWPCKEDIGEARAAAARPSEEIQQKQQQLETRCAALFERLNAITDATNAFRSNSSSGSEAESPTEADAAAAAAADGEGEGAAEAAKSSRQRSSLRKKKRKEVDPACLSEQQELLTQLQQLFREIETHFSSNKPAQVSAMIRCCNVLLRADGLAILKACADCEPLHATAQSIIETVVPCIWAT